MQFGNTVVRQKLNWQGNKTEGRNLDVVPQFSHHQQKRQVHATETALQHMFVAHLCQPVRLHPGNEDDVEEKDQQKHPKNQQGVPDKHQGAETVELGVFP